ncbi:hypothetical protein FOA22_13580 [Heyndrickxia oleronia]|uniref:hypothetical protein n=1 Tax=Heyndrickxia oleronia TaxID=38875 RepID=UPI0033359610
MAGLRKKVSGDALGPATISYGEAATITDSFTGNLVFNYEKYIKSGASFTWNHTASSLSKFSVSFPVPSGKIGYVGFTPYLNKTWGNSYIDTFNTAHVLISTSNNGLVYGYSPKKTSAGFADGLYALIIK